MASFLRSAVVLALLAWMSAAVLYAALALTYGQRSAFVHIRWEASVDAPTRNALETKYTLIPVESLELRTWRYQLMDVSRDNIHRLVTDPAVEDTHYIHRTAYRVWRTASRGGYNSTRPAWVASLINAAVWALGGIGILLLGGAALGSWRRRRAPAVDRPSTPLMDRIGAVLRQENGTPEREHRYRWHLATSALALPLVAGLTVTMWRAPFPISETVALMETARVLDPTVAESAESALQSFFDPTLRSWYRPLYHSTWYSLWHLTRDLDQTLRLFKLLEVGLVVALLWLFIHELQPRTLSQCAAAAFAVAVLVGMPAFRENLEVPLLYTLVGMPLVLGVWMLVRRQPRWWHVPAIVAMLVVAIGYKEQGLLIVPIVATAWWLGAPGATSVAVAASTVITAAYLALRLSTNAVWGPFEQDFSIGFTSMTSAEASERFGDFPWPAYAYNVFATVSNILFSEPTSGQFTITGTLLRGTPEPWQLNHLLSSAALTALIGWWGIRAWRAAAAGGPLGAVQGKRLDIARRGAWPLDCQVFAAAVVITLASGPLGFNYTRDRFGGMAAVFYAMAAYHAMRALHARITMPMRSARRTLYALAFAIVLATAWQLRAVGTLEGEHERAFKSRREWMVDLQRERVDRAEQRLYVSLLEAMAEQGTDPASAAPDRYPEWAAPWLR